MLTDDPLRLFRIVRFAARFNLTMEPALSQACRDQKVIDQLREKVSFERMIQELDKMLEHPNSETAINLLAEFNAL